MRGLVENKLMYYYGEIGNISKDQYVNNSGVLLRAFGTHIQSIPPSSSLDTLGRIILTCLDSFDCDEESSRFIVDMPYFLDATTADFMELEKL